MSKGGKSAEEYKVLLIAGILNEDLTDNQLDEYLAGINPNISEVINAIISDGETLIELAVRYRELHIIDHLLDRGANKDRAKISSQIF